MTGNLIPRAGSDVPDYDAILAELIPPRRFARHCLANSSSSTAGRMTRHHLRDQRDVTFCRQCLRNLRLRRLPTVFPCHGPPTSGLPGEKELAAEIVRTRAALEERGASLLEGETG